jgi:hypothetical protein
MFLLYVDSYRSSVRLALFVAASHNGITFYVMQKAGEARAIYGILLSCFHCHHGTPSAQLCLVDPCGCMVAFRNMKEKDAKIFYIVN